MNQYIRLESEKMAEQAATERPESQLNYVRRQGNVLFYRRRAELSELSGVPKSTLNKIMDGSRANSRSGTVQAIHDVLKAEEQRVEELKAKEKTTEYQSKA